MTKFDPPINENYAATVVRVRAVNKLPGLDNLVGVPVLGYQALVGKDVQPGDLMVAFTAETQLSPEFAFENNLYRHSEMNRVLDAKGYLEDNRRVRAIKLRGHRSDALLLSLESLEWTGVDIFQLKEGDTFDKLGGEAICQKYVVRAPRESKGQQVAKPKIVRVDERAFPQHFETDNYFRHVEMIAPDDQVIITQKLHGTSVRIGHVPVKRKLSWLERVARKLGVKVQEKEYGYVYGSRKVVKDPDNPFESAGFYGHDIYSEVGARLKGSIPKGYVVYGEIIGWVNNRPIQPGYTYMLPQGQAELYVYRVARVGDDGMVIDLSWDQVKRFCEIQGIKHVPELARMDRFDTWEAERLLDIRFVDCYGWSPVAVPTEKGTVDEGICIRRDDGLTPLILKAKSPIFLQHETKQLDAGEVDMESVDPEEFDAEVRELVDEFAGVAA